MTEQKTSGVAVAMKYFGKQRLADGTMQGLAAFRDEWNELTPTDKEQILGGINNGSMTY